MRYGRAGFRQENVMDLGVGGAVKKWCHGTAEHTDEVIVVGQAQLLHGKFDRHRSAFGRLC